MIDSVGCEQDDGIIQKNSSPMFHSLKKRALVRMDRIQSTGRCMRKNAVVTANVRESLRDGFTRPT